MTGAAKGHFRIFPKEVAWAAAWAHADLQAAVSSLPVVSKVDRMLEASVVLVWSEVAPDVEVHLLRVMARSATLAIGNARGLWHLLPEQQLEVTEVAFAGMTAPLSAETRHRGVRVLAKHSDLIVARNRLGVTSLSDRLLLHASRLPRSRTVSGEHACSQTSLLLQQRPPLI